MSAQWFLTFDKLMTADEVKALRKTLEAAVIIAKSKAHQGPVRDQCIIELALGTGLRVSELAALKIEDIDLKRGGNFLIVRHGKGDKLRQVKFSAGLKTLIQEYLDYRTSDSEYLFPSERQDHMFPTIRFGVCERAFRRYDGGRTTHSDIGTNRFNNGAFRWIKQQGTNAGADFY